MAETEFTIGTHSGTFHCDEVLSCFMLLKLHPVGKIIRTRDYSTLDKCDIVVDVGGIYDRSKFVMFINFHGTSVRRSAINWIRKSMIIILITVNLFHKTRFHNRKFYESIKWNNSDFGFDCQRHYRIFKFIYTEINLFR